MLFSEFRDEYLLAQTNEDKFTTLVNYLQEEMRETAYPYHSVTRALRWVKQYGWSHYDLEGNNLSFNFQTDNPTVYYLVEMSRDVTIIKKAVFCDWPGCRGWVDLDDAEMMPVAVRQFERGERYTRDWVPRLEAYECPDHGYFMSTDGVCPVCMEEQRKFWCYGHREWESMDDEGYNILHDGHAYCDDWVGSHGGECEFCHEYSPQIEEVKFGDRTFLVCPTCQDNYRLKNDGRLWGYHEFARGNTLALGVPNPKFATAQAVFGFEVELDPNYDDWGDGYSDDARDNWRDSHGVACAEEVWTRCEKTIHAESDCTCGCEFVSRPATLEFWEKNPEFLNELFKVTSNHGLYAQENGLHVHINSSWFRSNTSDKNTEHECGLMYVYDMLYEAIVDYTDREVCEAEHWADYSEGHGRTWRVFQDRGYDADDLRELVYQQRDDRYHAVNLAHDTSTIEIRLYGAADYADKLLAWLDFTKAAAKLAKANSLSCLLTMDERQLWNAVKDNLETQTGRKYFERRHYAS